MKNRPRPHIPLSIRIEVIARQLLQAGRWSADQCMLMCLWPAKDAEKLKLALALLFGTEPVALDHNPPLRARPYNPRIKNVAARYTPNANDPDHLIYRTVADHKLKTNVRGDGAQFPDRVLIKRERKRERGHDPKSNFRVKIQGRPFQNRPFPPKGSRPFPSRRL